MHLFPGHASCSLFICPNAIHSHFVCDCEFCARRSDEEIFSLFLFHPPVSLTFSPFAKTKIKLSLCREKVDSADPEDEHENDEEKFAERLLHRASFARLSCVTDQLCKLRGKTTHRHKGRHTYTHTHSCTHAQRKDTHARLFHAHLVPCSSLFACPLVVSRLSCATLSPFGICFLPL